MRWEERVTHCDQSQKWSQTQNFQTFNFQSCICKYPRVSIHCFHDRSITPQGETPDSSGKSIRNLAMDSVGLSGRLRASWSQDRASRWIPSLEFHSELRAPLARIPPAWEMALLPQHKLFLITVKSVWIMITYHQRMQGVMRTTALLFSIPSSTNTSLIENCLHWGLQKWSVTMTPPFLDDQLQIRFSKALTRMKSLHQPAWPSS